MNAVGSALGSAKKGCLSMATLAFNQYLGLTWELLAFLPTMTYLFALMTTV